MNEHDESGNSRFDPGGDSETSQQDTAPRPEVQAFEQFIRLILGLFFPPLWLIAAAVILTPIMIVGALTLFFAVAALGGNEGANRDDPIQLFWFLVPSYVLLAAYVAVLFSYSGDKVFVGVTVSLWRVLCLLAFLLGLLLPLAIYI